MGPAQSLRKKTARLKADWYKHQLEGMEDMSQVTQERGPVQIGALQVAIAVCILATAFMHLYAAIQPDEDFRFWFLPEGLGYVGLFIAFSAPFSSTASYNQFCASRICPIRNRTLVYPWSAGYTCRLCHQCD